jgi:hypothetical protein
MSACAALAIIASSTTAFAQDQPDATITFHGGSVGVIAGVNWGGGTLHYKGKDYPLAVSGLSLGVVGAKSYNLQGQVYHLTKVSDIQGTYAAGAAAATVAVGAGITEMQNGAGVTIKATTSSEGLNFKLGPSGLTIKMK